MLERLAILLCFLSTGLCAGTAPATSLDEAQRPRVGLVLGGGGAHATAHIGVIEELERQRIPIDFVVGTGIGGVVGGMYASGMTSDEIRKIFVETDWEDVFDPDTAREDLSFRRKGDDEDFLVKYRVGIKDGQAHLPTSLVPNAKLGHLLQTAVADSKAAAEFDSLVTPFRAIAMDLVTGEEVILDSGSLDRAMLATVSAPGTLPPVDIDGRMLITGSLLNNLPVDVAREMGADVVVAVDIESYTRDPDALNSVFGILDQVGHLLQKHNTTESIAKLRQGDFLIQPKPGPAMETDFSSIAEHMDEGASAVSRLATRLQPIRLGPGDYEAYAGNRFDRRQSAPIISGIEIYNQSDVDDSLILAMLSQETGEPLDTSSLEADIRQMYGTGAFSSVDFGLRKAGEETVLELHTAENPASSRFWRFGISLQDDLEGNSAFTGSASMTWTQLNRLGAEWRNVFRIGERQQVSTEFYQPLDRLGRYFIAASGGYLERNVTTIDNGNILAEARVRELSGTLSAGRIIGNSSEFRVSLTRGQGDARSNIGARFARADFDRGGFAASLTKDTFDNVYFPKEGVRAGLAWNGQRQSLGDSVNADIATGRFAVAKTWGEHSLLGALDIQTQIDDVAGVQNLVSTGGLFRLSGYRRGELSGRHVAVGRMIYYKRLRSSPLRGLLDAQLYFGGSLELGNAWDFSDDISLGSAITAGALFVGADTFVGPIYFAGGLAEGGRTALYLYIGRPY